MKTLKQFALLASLAAIVCLQAMAADLITAQSVSGITSTAATVNWTTCAAANSQVFYGTTTAYGSSTTLDATLVTSHAVALSGLTMATLYHFQVVSIDSSGNKLQSTDGTFTSAGSTGPVVVVNPANVTACAGVSVSFTSSASGNPSPTVQWKLSTDGGSTYNNIAGATSTTYSFTALVSQTGFKYEAVFTNPSGTTTSTAATLTVNTPPVITTQPLATSVVAGSNATFTAAASGSPSPSVQWQVSTNGGTTWTDIPGANSTTLTLTGATVGLNGNLYRATFSNSCTNAGISLSFAGATLPVGVTFTRASSGTYINASGVLSTASNDVPRFNYATPGSRLLGLLIEPSATNLAKQSNAFSTSPWFTINGAVATGAQFTSPDGTNDGWSLTSGTGLGGLNGSSSQITWSAQPYTASVWAKFITGTVDGIFSFNGSFSGGLGVGPSISRFSQTVTPAAGTGPFILNLRSGTGTDGFFGAQVETGPVATSYIPTTTTSATRAADAATFTVPSTVGTLTYTFDDNSTQVVPATPGSYTIPTNLNRPNILGVAGGSVGSPAVNSSSSALTVTAAQTYSLSSSTNSGRTSGSFLQGKALSGTNYLFTSLANSATTFNVSGVSKACYFLDDVLMAGSGVGCDFLVPFDFNSSSTIPAFVQGASGPATLQATNTSVAVAYPAAQTIHDLNVVAIGQSTPFVAITSVTDTRGNTYTLIGTNSNGAARQSFYYAKDIAAGANTVTVAFTGTANFPDVRIGEYGGLDTTAPFDQGSANIGNGTAANSAPVTTSAASEMLIAAGVSGNAFTAPGSGFTSRGINVFGNILEDESITSIGSYSATATAATGIWILHLGAFKASSGLSGWDTTKVTNGTHTVTQVVTPVSGPPEIDNATFTVSNSVGHGAGLSWVQGTIINPVTYSVYRAAGACGGTFSPTRIASGLGSTSYSDSSVVSGSTYCYGVTQIDSVTQIQSSYSNLVTATIP